MVYLVPQVDLGEAESLQMNARSTDCRSHCFQEHLLQILAHERPSLLQNLQERPQGELVSAMKTI
jgi:hypothetical protein